MAFETSAEMQRYINSMNPRFNYIKINYMLYICTNTTLGYTYVEYRLLKYLIESRTTMYYYVLLTLPHRT